jgi:hypothetical protein
MPRCEAMFNPGEWPYIKRCENEATVVTPEGSNYCEDHADWDDE